MQALEAIFGHGGPLERAVPGFKPRRQQALMACRIAAALEARESLLVEAGTGTGKTFAYLVPALFSGRRVLISTGTRTLQDQLFAKDLPLVAAAIGRPARVALLKGRSNYLCLERLTRARQGQGATQIPLAGLEPEPQPEGSDTEAALGRIERWSHTTRSGDLAEVPGLSDADGVWGLVTATRDTCLGSTCPQLTRCHVARSRREAQEADLVIVNHHLLLSDLTLKEEGFADLLGSADALIIDEAHQLPDLASLHFGVRLSSRILEGLLEDIEREVRLFEPAAGAGARRILEALGEARAARASLQEALPAKPGRFALEELPGAVCARARELSEAFGLLQQLLEQLDEPALRPVAARAARREEELTWLTAVDETEGSRAVEVTGAARAGGAGFVLSLTPLDISARFRALCESSGASWIFTSATLSVGEDFSAFASRLGLSEAAHLKIPSPFDFESQALLYLPSGPRRLPAPADRGYPAAVIDTALPLIEAAGGGAFVLFTSHRALQQAARDLRQRWGGGGGFPLLVQGEAPREQQLAAFRSQGHAVLLGTASFWEGVDVQGEALRLVVIEKLPFASPEDPLVRSRIEHLKARGGDPFWEYQLPAAVLALRQGVGRLIRSEDDHGVVVLCDPRMQGRGYGRVFLAALPPMTVTLELADALAFLRRHFSKGQAAAGAL